MTPPRPDRELLRKVIGLKTYVRQVELDVCVRSVLAAATALSPEEVTWALEKE